MNMRTLGWLLGGVLLATGIITLMFSFDSGGADIALSLERVGWDAVGDVGPNANFPYAMACIVLGAALVIPLNANQWRHTGGY